MTVHFDFTLDDNEAETLFLAVQGSIVEDHESILDMMASEHPEEYKTTAIECIKEHIEYTKSIMTKMTNTRISDND